jgi:glutaconyl-CoA/methylmalonyl-CoA decarboxylase subunit gamma
MDHLRITVQGQVYDVIVENIESDSITKASTPLAKPTHTASPSAPPPPQKPIPAGSPGDATSPLAGLVQAIEVSIGATIEAGALVITLEAMKMYTPINATASGTITAIHVKVGDAVDEGQILYTVA